MFLLVLMLVTKSRRIRTVFPFLVIGGKLEQIFSIVLAENLFPPDRFFTAWNRFVRVWNRIWPDKKNLAFWQAMPGNPIANQENHFPYAVLMLLLVLLDVS